MKRLLYLHAPLLTACAALLIGQAQASSHREAPFITEQPKIDATDFYLFKSYEPGRSGYVTMIADYVPLQAPYGGPNYFMMDPKALYEIHVDNNGDAKEDITFQFRFANMLKDTQFNIGGKNVSIPIIQSGQVTAGATGNLNVTESYALSVVYGNRRTGTPQRIVNAATGATNFSKPVDNIGNKTIPDYPTYATSHLYEVNVPGCAMPARVFVGQRKDPFVVNLGETFDLINTNPLGPVDGEKDDLADANVTSLILEMHQSCLTRSDEPVIGAWTTASVRQLRTLKPGPTFDKPAENAGAWVQQSRLSAPLVNELVIGLKDKNKFNASEPKDDAQFADYVTNPTLPALIQLLFPTAPAPTLFPRTDLVAAFLTGVNTTATGNLNQPRNVVPAEMLRLNTAIPPTMLGQQNNLGVIGGDLAGFPNGRRPGDDVVDIALRVAMGKLIAIGLYGSPAQAPAGNAPLTDGAWVNDSYFDNTFPYLKPPLAGSPN